nr:hypothetical protein [Tanacetum cinerariifolium]
MTGNVSYLSDNEPYDGGTPRQHNMYSIDLNNVVPHKDLTFLVAKASADKCMLCHRRLGHLNFKTMNRLVRHKLVRGLPSKCFDNDHTCVAYLKGKQHKASCKTKLVNSVTKPFHTLHMDLFGPTSVSSLNHKWYCLVVTDDFSRCTWTFFLKTKDETSGILRNFITKIENLKDLKVKIIRCDNRGEFRNKEMNDLCSRKGIKREFSNARTRQQNEAEAVNTACYVQNKVLVNKSQNKTSYELFNGRTPAIGFLKPFGCHVMILNTLDNLGKFEAKGDECYFIGYSMSSKEFRVFNKRTKRVEENLHVDFLENKPIEKGAGPNWLFDIDSLTNFMNYVPVVVAGTNSSGNFNPTATLTNPLDDHMETLRVETPIPTFSSPVPTDYLNDSPKPSSDTRLISKRVTSQDDTPSLDNILTLTNRFEDTLGVTNTNDSNGVKADLGNMEYNISASPTLTLRIHKDHLKSQIIGPMDTPVKTRTKSKELEEQSFIATIHQKTNPALLQGTIDQTLFIIRQRGDFILVQVYVDDIIFGSSNPQLCREFKALMHEKFQISAMGDILKKFRYSDVRSANTPMDKENPWGKDGNGKDVDLHLYRSMIGSLMYLTASRPDIMFAVCTCVRHQVAPKECHLHAVKRIFRYLKDDNVADLLTKPFDVGRFQYLVVEHAMRGSVKGNHIIYTNFFWSTARIETTDKGTNILATVDGKSRTISESSIRRNLKMKDDAGISSLPDAELFKNLTLMGYNILPNQKFSFQKGQFSHQWKYLIHTIMQCLSLKSTGFNDFSSNISTALVCLATNRVYNFSKIIFDGMVRNVNNKVSKILMYPRANITKTSTLPSDSTPRVTSLAADEGNMQHKLTELTDLCTHLQRQQDKMASKLTAQDQEIATLKAKIKNLEDRDGGYDDPSGEDATIKGRRLETREEAGIERSTEKGSDDTEEMVNVLTTLDAASVLSSGVQVSVPPAADITTVSVSPTTISVPTGSDVVPTASPIFTTATVSTPYSRRKGKEKMVESETPKKKKLQEQMDVQMARQLEEEMAKDAQRMNEQIARDAEIVRIHAEEELQIMIDGLNRNNEIVAKYLQKYEQLAAELSIEERIELISDLDSAKKVKTLEKISEEDLKAMMQLVPVEEVYVEALQLWVLMKETLNIRQATSDKEKELWVELKRRSTRLLTVQVNKVIEGILSSDEFPLPEEVPTASEDRFSLLKKRDATAEKIALLIKTGVSHGQRHIYNIQRRMTVTQLC